MALRVPWSRRPWVWIVAALGLALSGYSWIRSRGPKVPVALVIRHDLEQHLVASGRVMAPARIEAAALTAGLVVAVGPSEGDTVGASEVLVQLDEAEARAQLAQAEAAVALARARAQQVGSVAAVVASGALEQARAAFDAAEQQYNRTRSLVDRGALAQRDLEEAHRALDVARAQRASAEAQERGASARGVDTRAALAALDQALAQRSLAGVRLAQTRVVALQPALVLTRSVEPGSVVSPGRTLMTLAAVGTTRLVVQLDERDLRLVRIGMPARAASDAFPEVLFDATVSYIAPSIDAQRGTVEVHLNVPSPPPELRADMTVSVDLAVAQRASAVVVPSDAVRGLATARPWALAVAGGRAVRRDLRLGVRGDGSVEVASGLAPGDVVILPDGQSVAPGQRVRTLRREP